MKVKIVYVETKSPTLKWHSEDCKNKVIIIKHLEHFSELIMDMTCEKKSNTRNGQKRMGIYFTAVNQLLPFHFLI